MRPPNCMRRSYMNNQLLIMLVVVSITIVGMLIARKKNRQNKNEVTEVKEEQGDSEG